MSWLPNNVRGALALEGDVVALFVTDSAVACCGEEIDYTLSAYLCDGSTTWCGEVNLERHVDSAHAHRLSVPLYARHATCICH